MEHRLFEGLSEEGRARLERARQRVTAPKGRRIITRGERAAGVYLVEAGALRVFHEDAEGRQRTLYRLRPGDACVLALNCAFTGVRYPADVDVEEDARVSVVDGETWRLLFETEPHAREATVTLLASWVFDLLGALDVAVSTPLPARLADELLERMGPDGRVYATHAELAAHLGSAREVVSRAVARWRDEGLVRTGRGWIEVVDPAGLGE